ncbi:Dos2-interacting transcription regulator of RNA-Pol-II-domain-containing protein [Naematelia encephala]|uniref:MMS19 nucleotide excision repair protein n=1 Tax=Naematelia encephala TaxID=71784 RepID=A0A1Y2BJN4_9TREE|nr:Dos2-interacting transcription regulator of RNA-Pol-II-domain-containing protein [Naematelia encephala]
MGLVAKMDVARIVRTHITTAELEPPTELITSVNDGSTPLLEVVKGLGEYLTSTEDDVRLKGLTFLSNVVKVIAPGRYNRQATQTLTRYFLSKLDDFDSLPSALQALTVLSKLPTFDDEAAVDVYKAVVEEVNLKSYVQATRHMVYVLFDSLLATHRSALKAMGSDFINSYTKMVDGEKDPRNLLLLFSMEKVILLEFDVKDHIEDMFDITFCYFPITFKPPPNDPYGITADDLKLALRQCMSASPYFAKMAIPLFLEKFSTATGHSMRDLMLSMAACFPIYGVEAVGERGGELWEGIRTEIMYSSDTTIEAAALSALESLMRTLYPTEAEVPTGLAQDIIKEALTVLEEPEKSQGIASTKILAALVRASPSAGKYALSQALPQLFRQFNSPSLPSHRSPILSAISSLLISAQSVYSAPESGRHQYTEKSLEPFREPLLDVLREGLRTESLRGPAIRGSVALVEIPGFWGRDEVEDVVRGMNDILINDGDVEIRSAVINGLTTISRSYSSTIETVTLPLLFHHLPDTAPSLSDIDARSKYRSILDSLSRLCIQPSLFETLVIRINSKLDLLAPTPISDVETDEQECNVAYCWDLLNTLLTVIERKLVAKHLDIVKYFDAIVPRLYGLCVEAALPRAGGGKTLFGDRRLLSLVGRIGETMTWELNTERQAKQIDVVYKAFEKGEIAAMIHETTQIRTAGSPLRNGASSSEQDLIAVYSSTLQGLKAETPLPFSDAADYLSGKIHWTIHVATSPFQLRFALDAITALVNKRATELQSSLAEILEMVWVKEVIDTSNEFEVRRRGLLVYLHIVKALALIRHQLAYDAVLRVIECLSLASFDPVFVNEAARGFSVLAEGKGKGRERGSHLTAKLLCAQKLWNVVLPKLIEADRDATGKTRLVYLVAFSSLLPLVPSSLCLSDLPTILPLILRSLTLPDPVQRTNAITTLTSILETQNMSADVDKIIHQNAVTMVEGLAKSVLPDPSGDLETSGKVRSAALRCLAFFPDVVRHETLHTVKSDVLRDLGKALDDPLRIVRREAVECRAKWYRYGAAV